MLQSQVCMRQNKTNHESKNEQQALQSRLGVWGFSRKKGGFEELSWRICWYRWLIDGVFPKLGSSLHGALWETPGQRNPPLLWRRCLCYWWRSLEEGEGIKREMDTLCWDRNRHDTDMSCVAAVYPSMLCHACGRSHNRDHSVHLIFTSIH